MNISIFCTRSAISRIHFKCIQKGRPNHPYVTLPPRANPPLFTHTIKKHVLKNTTISKMKGTQLPSYKRVEKKPQTLFLNLHSVLRIHVPSLEKNERNSLLSVSLFEKGIKYFTIDNHKKAPLFYPRRNSPIHSFFFLNSCIERLILWKIMFQPCIVKQL